MEYGHKSQQRMTDFQVLLFDLCPHINHHYNPYPPIFLCSDLHPPAKYGLYCSLELPVSLFLDTKLFNIAIMTML